MNRRQFLTTTAGAALVAVAAPVAVAAAPAQWVRGETVELLDMTMLEQYELAEFEAALVRQLAVAFCVPFELLRKESAAIAYPQFDAPVRA